MKHGTRIKRKTSLFSSVGHNNSIYSHTERRKIEERLRGAVGVVGGG
jgi:hypothetical protein